jgi:hypothetical protein
MASLFLKNKQFKHYNACFSTVKLFSFRRHTFTSYFGLFIRFSLLYLNRIYMLLQSTRLFNLFLLIVLSKQSFMGSLNSIVQLCDSILNTSYYFSSNTSFYQSILSLFTCTCNISKIFSFLKVYFYSFFIIFSLFKSTSMNLVSLPKINKVFTVLRSPHTDKKSREQFNLIMSSKFFVDSLGLTSFFLKYLNNLYLSSLFLKLSEKNSYFY